MNKIMVYTDSKLESQISEEKAESLYQEKILKAL